ncbi:neutrophil cytosol factor 2 [Cynoglossus semilaevis]|uniref:neutrophil cytosol factor 2 n=1 Tax=Cynoglossus semilaevis TaxID=244447 RepID=UPI000D6238B4|nr:neutrophil cytosol factor 2-like [Cynoglossus semilaevis]
MSFVDTLRLWDEAVTCVDKEDLSEALRIFLSIEEPNSKICFNMGCLHLLKEDLDAAEKAFDNSIRKDEHLAVAFFQRGIAFYKKNKYEESLGDFQRAFKALRGNQLIDYKALGLRYKLYACDVLNNMALAEAELGNWETAQENLVKALDYKIEAKLNAIDKALQSTLKQKLFKLVEFPSKVLFKPNKHYVAELEKKDYLGKAKVVASVVPADEFSGFAPLQPQTEDGPTFPKEPEVIRALEGDPHTVLFEFVPETSDELSVVPGNIVFVLQRGDDNWASVVFNDRRGLVPYNYLEPLELASKQNEEIRKAPNQKPPTRPHRKPGLTPFEDVNKDRKSKDLVSADDSRVIKIHHTFSFAVSVPAEFSYDMLIEKGLFSLSSEADEQSAIRDNTDMERMWQQPSGRWITLWCNTKEPTSEKSHDIQLVALHSYKSSNPEDLNFVQGDTITLLSRVNQDWLEGQCSGHTGIFPASFVEEITTK